MKAKLLTLAFSMGCIATSHAYQLSGIVTGIQSGGKLCHIAVEDPNQAHYSNAWHAVNSDNICAIAKLAYVTGSRVMVSVTVDNETRDTANDIASIEATSRPVKWPPYYGM